MKSLKYIWRNVKRNKLRTLLTILSVGFSLALMTVLHGYMAMQNAWGGEAAKNNRIVVMNIQGFSGLLPIAAVDDVRNIDRVEAAVPYSWYGGDYRETRMPFAQFATDPQFAFDVWPEYEIDSAQLNDWQNDRRGCVADRKLAEKWEWNVGDRIPLKGTLFPFDLDLTLCGVFDAPLYTDSLWFHWKYLDEGLRQMNSYGTGNAGTIFARASSAEAIPEIISQVDDKFGNSENPTRTQTEAAFAQMFADMVGNIGFFIMIIGVAVVFALSLVTANAMAMSIRERTTEVAVLKAIGFPRLQVLRFILGESCLIALLGGIMGVAMGCGLLQMLHVVLGQMFPFGVFEMLGPWLLTMLLIAIGIGLIGGIVPAIRAAQLSVIDGLRRVV